MITDEEFRLTNELELDFLTLSEGFMTVSRGATGLTGTTGATGAGSAYPTLNMLFYNVPATVSGEYMQINDTTGSVQEAEYIMGKTGQITKLNLYHKNNPDGSWIYTVMINNVASSLAISSEDSGYFNSVGSVSFVANDRVSVLTSGVAITSAHAIVSLEYNFT